MNTFMKIIKVLGVLALIILSHIVYAMYKNANPYIQWLRKEGRRIRDELNKNRRT